MQKRIAFCPFLYHWGGVDFAKTVINFISVRSFSMSSTSFPTPFVFLKPKARFENTDKSFELDQFIHSSIKQLRIISNIQSDCLS